LKKREEEKVYQEHDTSPGGGGKLAPKRGSTV